MVTFGYDSLLQTITSRSQLINVPPNQIEEIRDHLIEKNIHEQQAMQLAKISQGRLGVAFRLLQSEDEMGYQQFRDWMLACWNRDLTSLVHGSEEFSKRW